MHKERRNASAVPMESPSKVHPLLPGPLMERANMLRPSAGCQKCRLTLLQRPQRAGPMHPSPPGFHDHHPACKAPHKPKTTTSQIHTPVNQKCMNVSNRFPRHRSEPYTNHWQYNRRNQNPQINHDAQAAAAAEPPRETRRKLPRRDQTRRPLETDGVLTGGARGAGWALAGCPASKP